MIPAPLNQVLSRIKPGMTGEEAKVVLITAYTKLQASVGVWEFDRGTGYLEFHLDGRYSVLFMAHTSPGEEPRVIERQIG